jgi:selenide,water dikinase
VFDLTYASLVANNLTKAHGSNREYTQSSIDFSPIDEIEKLVYFDPQTSGGLLLSVAPHLAESIVNKLKVKFPKVSIIGSVTERTSHYVRVE